jgi:hypothetical protein
MKVIGMEKNTNSFIVACDRFIYIEVLDGAIQKKSKTVKYYRQKTSWKKKTVEPKNRLRNH